MFAYILIVWLMTADGPVERRIDFEGRGRSCEAAARDIRLGTVRPPRGVTVISARCVQEYEA